MQQNNKLSGKVILVVDDESVMRDVVSIMFEDAGARVISAASGEEAVELQHTNQGVLHIDLACLDFSMPGMNGYETLSALRAKQNNMSCLIISGLEMTEEVGKLVASSEAVFLAKPFSEEKLIESATKAMNL